MNSATLIMAKIDHRIADKMHSYRRKRLLENADGILHIGGHFGQEAMKYASMKSKVVWIEAHPEFFQILKNEIKQYPDQVAINALLGETPKKTKFYVASNEGASSSIFDLSLAHGFENIGLSMTTSVELEMRRLDDVIEPNIAQHLTHWVVDVQGAELSVLKGAGELIKVANSMEVEVSTREVYQGGVLFEELNAFLGSRGFKPVHNPRQNWHGDVLFVRA